MRSLVTARSCLGALFVFLVAMILLVASFALARAPTPSERPPSAKASSSAKASAAAVSGAAAGAVAGGGAGGSVTHNEERQAPSMGAPVLTAFGGCKGSVSGGVGVAGFGVALGATIADEECERLNSAAFLATQGHGDAAVALVCENRGVAAAMARVGKACPGAEPIALTPAPTGGPARHPACAPSSWATREWRASNCAAPP
jgi:hypothetical protein